MHIMYVVADRRFNKSHRVLMPKCSRSALFLAPNAFLPSLARCLEPFGCKCQPSKRGKHLWFLGSHEFKLCM